MFYVICTETLYVFNSRVSVKRTVHGVSLFCSHLNITALVKSTVQDASLSSGKAVRRGAGNGGRWYLQGSLQEYGTG